MDAEDIGWNQKVPQFIQNPLGFISLSDPVFPRVGMLLKGGGLMLLLAFWLPQALLSARSGGPIELVETQSFGAEHKSPQVVALTHDATIYFCQLRSGSFQSWLIARMPLGASGPSETVVSTESVDRLSHFLSPDHQALPRTWQFARRAALLPRAPCWG